MVSFAIAAAAVTAILGVIVVLTMEETRRPTTMALLFVAFTAVIFAASSEIAGTSKPLVAEWRDIRGLPVIGLSWDEASHVVYVWVMRSDGPASYRFPWPADAQQAADLQERWRRRQQTGEQFTVADDSERVAKIALPPPQKPKETTP